jgi:tRNA nucleotidyltransferase/poly(A) polymerase
MGLKEVLINIDNLSKRYQIDKPYIVGGLPRDVYMENTPLKTTDIDITTNSSEVLRLGILIAEELNVPFELSDDGHLTVFADDFDLDFSSHFISYEVVKHLNGKFKNLEEAFSRDFTINTLHQDLVTKEIIDPTKMGFNDIKNKIIRTPVPAEITLTDDPRRAYRAINLAARYNFKIHEDIKYFTLSNPNIFRSENIKDKYIAVKISKALKEDEEYTLHLLRELGLFKNVPLSGLFKDVLIKRKLLSEYLVDAGPKVSDVKDEIKN